MSNHPTPTVKAVSPYDDMKIAAKKLADSMPTITGKVEQNILWIKAAATCKIQLTDEVYYVTKDDQFGFSEQFVNLLMAYAYEKGRSDSYEHAQNHYREYEKMIEKIREIVSD